MNKLEAIAAAKTFRKEADDLLQRMKQHRRELIKPVARPKPTIAKLEAILSQAGDKNVSIEPSGEVTTAAPLEGWGDDPSEAIAQHTLSIRDLESCIMRQGMTLKYIGNPTPYPTSYDPASPVVEPTADGLKMRTCAFRTPHEGGLDMRPEVVSETEWTSGDSTQNASNGPERGCLA